MSETRKASSTLVYIALILYMVGAAHRLWTESECAKRVCSRGEPVLVKGVCTCMTRSE